MRKLQDRQKRKYGQSQSGLFAAVSIVVPFEFRSTFSMEECVYWLRKENISVESDLYVRRADSVKRIVTISEPEDETVQFIIQTRIAGRSRSIVRIEGFLQTLEDKTLLVKGRIHLASPILGILFTLIMCILMTIAFGFVPFGLVWGLLLGAAPVLHYLERNEHLRYIRSVLGQKHKFASS
jgi:hypothetical protein